MTTLVERADVSTQAPTLRGLAGLEARRYARHPLFLTGVALLLLVMAIGSDELDASGDASVAPAFFLGLLGVFVGHRLTRSMARSSDAVEASPTDAVTRTAALCLACLVPGAVALFWGAWMIVAMNVWPIPDSAAVSAADIAAFTAAGVVYAVGGPLVGVMVGRWARFPGAGLVAVVALVGWVLLATFGLAMSASRIGTLVHLNAPYTAWTSADGPDSSLWVAGGSPQWYLVYVTTLCGLAATVAMLHGASGPKRSRLVRVLAIVAVLAIASLGLASAADPTRIPL